MGSLSDGLKALWEKVNDLKEIPWLRIEIERMRSISSTIEKENQLLKEEISKLEAQLKSAHAHAPEFVDAGACLLKKNPGGGFHDGYFCIKCKGPLRQLRQLRGKPYGCTGCRTEIDYSSIQAARKFMAKLSDAG